MERIPNPLDEHLTRVLYSKEVIHQRVLELGAQITEDYMDRDLVLVGILRGAAVFLCDLSRAIAVPHSWDMCGASSYHGGTATSGHVQITKDVEVDLRNKHVIVVEDIYDSGRTLRAICDLLRVHQPASIEVCALLYKEKVQRASEVAIKYVGFEIPDEFVVGYGLDYNEYYRNLECIGILDPKIYS
ncbi:MAG: hypoxanthine phosphoribosyltransferase [Candidatus Sumerlaeia bacterium]|nr:hypoxanthine phosphoribosyltransferase [Candidatus Sumerlaeia bacterium]